MSKSTWALREEDKNHVVWPAINQRNLLGQLKEGFDTVGVPAYPVQTFDDFEVVWIVCYQGRLQMGNSRAMWNILQILLTWKCLKRPPRS